MLELYGANTGNCYRAAIALHEAGLPFIAKIVELRNGEQRGPAFLELNPAAQVPVLVDRNAPGEPLVLTQSNAIIFYAANRSGDRQLVPTDNARRTRTTERFFHFVTDAITWSGAAFSLARRGFPEAAAALEAQLLERLEASERFLADGPFMAGETFTIADIAGFTIIRAYRSQLNLTSDQPLSHWFDRVAARPPVRRGMAAFQTN